MESKETYIYRNIIEDMSDGVVVISFDGKITLCNHVAAEALNVNDRVLIGKSVMTLMSEFEENDEFFELLLDAVYQKQKIKKNIPFRTGGEMRYLKVTTSFLTDGSEKIALIVVINNNTDPVGLFIRNKRLANQILRLMNSFVEVMVTETEERSPYNANHTKSMVKYATKYLKWLESRGELTKYTNENTGPLLMSVWLHDIGKLLIPQNIMDKPDRLGARLTDVQYRIEINQLVLRMKMLSEPDKKEHYQSRFEQTEEAEKFILSCNTAGFIDRDTIEKLRETAELTCFTSDGREIPLLNPPELEALSISKGTLTDNERRIIESHVTYTRELLSKMEFHGDYKNVPLWAAGHHELLDGSGYPDKLTAADIPWETRLLTIIDIYDALTAEDRPYKPPMPPEKAFGILGEMSEAGKVDKSILSSFYESGAWKKS